MKEVELLLITVQVLSVTCGLVILAVAALLWLHHVLNKRVAADVHAHYVTEPNSVRDMDVIHNYPHIATVAAADRFQLGVWWRFLRSPVTKEEQETLNLIVKRLKGSGGWDPQLSKVVGWDLEELRRKSRLPKRSLL